jgi:zinc resistance-associated protein
MSKLAIAGIAALCIAATSPAYAQAPQLGGPAQDRITEADLKALTERRVDLVKAALQLTPAQEKYWPAVEAAIRARADMRRDRLSTIGARVTEQQERSPIELLRERADALTARGAALKKLVDAWQPLYESLDNRQKLRLRFLSMYVLREMRDAVESRRFSEEDYDD